MQEESQVLERHLIEMLTLAGEYCIMMEKLEQVEKDDLLIFLQKVSPILYIKGLLFPVTPEPEEGGDERMVTEEQWEQVFNSIRNKLGEADKFRFFDPIQETGEDIQTFQLSEIYADVYQDMKDFAWLMTKNTLLARQFAAFNIRKYFIENWGYKLLKAQIILHSRLIKTKETSDFEQEEE
ncbi:MAG: DUF5063 domain-containing protein [Bacteroidales bacterium]|nr:DUF5063 domain-containing protein [Bacteroidales bacterium]